MQTQASGSIGYNIYTANNQPQRIKKQAKKNKLKKHVCAYEGCTKSYKYPYQLQDHICTHTGEKNYACDVCNSKFTNVQLLKQHEQIHENKLYTCHTCNKDFRRKEHLDVHKRTIYHINKAYGLKDLKYECDLCDEKFTYKKDRHNHYLTNHDNYRAYQCTLCSKCYASDTVLKKHLKTHNLSKTPKKIKDYSCDICTMTFRRLIKLEQHHKQEHPDQKPFICKICNAGLLSQGTKNQHIKRAHGLSQSEYDAQTTQAEETEDTSQLFDSHHNDEDISSYLIKDEGVQCILDFPKELSDISEANTASTVQINNVHVLPTSEDDIQSIQSGETEDITVEDASQLFDSYYNNEDLSYLMNYKEIQNVLDSPEELVAVFEADTLSTAQ